MGKTWLINKNVIKDHFPNDYHISEGQVKWYSGVCQYVEPITIYRRHDNSDVVHLVGVRHFPVQDQHLDKHFTEIYVNEEIR